MFFRKRRRRRGEIGNEKEPLFKKYHMKKRVFQEFFSHVIEQVLIEQRDTDAEFCE